MAVYHTAMQVRAILFDFFGTLVDYAEGTEGQSFAEAHRVLRESGATVDEPSFLAAWGRAFQRLEASASESHTEFPFSAIVDGLLDELALASVSGDFHERFTDTFLGEWSRSVRYYDWLAEMLDELSPDYRLGIITNTYHPALVPSHLERMGVAGHFEVVVKSVDIGVRKPAPAIFFHALQQLGLQPSEVIFVGDSYLPDYVGPTSIGMGAYLIDPAGRHPVPDAIRLSSVADLPSRLR